MNVFFRKISTHTKKKSTHFSINHMIMIIEVSVKKYIFLGVGMHDSNRPEKQYKVGVLWPSNHKVIYDIHLSTCFRLFSSNGILEDSTFPLKLLDTIIAIKR